MKLVLPFVSLHSCKDPPSDVTCERTFDVELAVPVLLSDTDVTSEDEVTVVTVGWTVSSEYWLIVTRAEIDEVVAVTTWYSW